MNVPPAFLHARAARWRKAVGNARTLDAEADHPYKSHGGVFSPPSPWVRKHLFVGIVFAMGWGADIAISSGIASTSEDWRMEEAYRVLREGWAGGDRDRERALHLLYLAWWHWAEPEFLTGLSYDPDAVTLWHEIFNYFGGKSSDDAELLYIAAVMAGITPWAFGNEHDWAEAAESMKVRSLLLQPCGFSPEAFSDRGEYGAYFTHQSSVTRQ